MVWLTIQPEWSYLLPPSSRQGLEKPALLGQDAALLEQYLDLLSPVGGKRLSRFGKLNGSETNGPSFFLISMNGVKP